MYKFNQNYSAQLLSPNKSDAISTQLINKAIFHSNPTKKNPAINLPTSNWSIISANTARDIKYLTIKVNRPEDEEGVEEEEDLELRQPDEIEDADHHPKIKPLHSQVTKPNLDL